MIIKTISCSNPKTSIGISFSIPSKLTWLVSPRNIDPNNGIIKIIPNPSIKAIKILINKKK